MSIPNWTNAQVISQLDSGDHWRGSTISYAFPTTRSGMYGTQSERPGFQAVDASQQAVIRLALKGWDDLIPQIMEETTSSSSYVEFSNPLSI